MTENPVKRYGLVLLASAAIFQLSFAQGGIYDYIKTKYQIRSAAATVSAMEKENEALTKELDRLQKDDQYLEEVVRTRYGLVRDGERVYRIEK